MAILKRPFLLDAIPEDSDDYLSALIVKADLYQMEGLTDVARDKLLEQVNYQMTH